MTSFIKYFYLIFTFLFLSISSSKLLAIEASYGVDLGLGFLDVGAETNGKKISDLSGEDVSTDYDTGALVGRVYGEINLDRNIYLDLGYFNTSDVKAKYTLSGSTSSERYEASGFDLSVLYKFDAADIIQAKKRTDVFFKAGLHSSTLDGNENIIISGTSYATKATDSGIGYLFGGGYDYDDKNRIGVSFYGALGGQSKNNLTFIYYGYKF